MKIDDDYIAAALQHYDLAKLNNMIIDGVDVNLLKDKKNDVLMISILKENFALFSLVLDKGFNCNNEMKLKYLQKAMRTYDINFIKKIISSYEGQGIDWNLLGEDNNTLLHYLVSNPRDKIPLEIFIFLNGKGLSWKKQNDFGQTPLHMLLRTYNMDLVLAKYLLGFSDVFKIKDFFDITPLDILLSYSKDDRWLAENKEIIEIINKETSDNLNGR